MDFVNKLTGSEKNKPVHTMDGSSSANTSTNNAGGGLMDKLHGMAGGGPQSEKNEDGLDKGVDWVQENVLGQGPQNNENAVEQAKDEQISDFVRSQYKKGMGKDVPIADK